MSTDATGKVWRYGDKWRARIQVNGKRKQETFDSERAAWTWIKAARVVSTSAPKPAPLTLLDVAATWFKTRQTEGRVRHVKKEISVWRKVETWQDAHRPLRSLTRRHIHEYVSALGAEAGVSRQTVKHVLRLVRQVVSHAHDTGLLSEDVADGLRVPKAAHVSSETAWTWLTLAEIQAVLDAAHTTEQRALVALAVYSGLRKGEIWQLRWSWIRLDGDSPEIDVRGELKSETSERTVPLLPPVVAALKAWKREQRVMRAAAKKPEPLTGLVFPSASGGVRRSDDDMGWASKRWRQKAPKAGSLAKRDPDGTVLLGDMRVTIGVPVRAGITRRVRFHDLRHTCASHLVQGSWGPALSLEEVRQWMGHSSIQVTQRYAHLSPKGLRAKAHAMREQMTDKALPTRSGSGTEAARIGPEEKTEDSEDT